MSPAEGPGTLYVYVGPLETIAGVHAAGRWVEESMSWRPIDSADASRHMDHDDVASALQLLGADVLSKWEVANVKSVRALVGDIWLSQVSVPWSREMQVGAHADAQARQFLAAAGSPVGKSDVVVMDDAPSLHPRLASAYPRKVLEALTEFAARVGPPLHSVLPVSVAAWSVASNPSAATHAFAVIESGSILVAEGAGRISEVTVRRTDFGLRDDPSMLGELGAQWSRHRLRRAIARQAGPLEFISLLTDEAGEPAGDGDSLVRIQVPEREGSRAPSALRLALHVGARRASLDAIDQVRPLSGARRVVVAAMLMISVALIVLSGSSTDETGQLVRDSSRNGRRQHDQEGQFRPAPSNLGAADLARIRSVDAALASLNAPVFRLMASLVPKQDVRVALLSLEWGGSSGGDAEKAHAVRLSGEAESSAEMTRYVEFLAGREPFVAASLTHHLSDASAPSNGPVRFSVEASLQR